MDVTVMERVGAIGHMHSCEAAEKEAARVVMPSGGFLTHALD